MIHVVLADDSITQREILKAVLHESHDIRVVAEATTGREAVEAVRHYRPDVLVTDMHMPEGDGVEVTRILMLEAPLPIIVISSTMQKQGMDHGLDVLRYGAVMALDKPEGAVLLHLREIGAELREAVRVAADIPRSRLALPQLPAESFPGKSPPESVTGSPDFIGICASTGGPAILPQLFSALPEDFSIPIFLVLHIPKGFEEGFVSWIAKMCRLKVRLVRGGERPGPGVWFAPPGCHLTLGPAGFLMLKNPAPGDIHCPSGDPLFESMARVAGPRGAGVILTGMGGDGAQGLLALRQSGGMTIIQSEASCLIWGMPKVAKSAGAAMWELDPTGIASKFKTWGLAYQQREKNKS